MPTENRVIDIKADQNYYSNGVLISSTPYTQRHLTLIRTSVRTPQYRDYKRLRYRGVRAGVSAAGLPMNPFLFRKEEQRVGTGTYEVTAPTIGFDVRYTGNLYGVTFYTDGGLPYEPSPSEAAELRRKTEFKILEKLKNQKVNLAQVFAERKMTADLIASSATRIAQSFIALKKGDILGAARRLGGAGSTVPVRKVRAFRRQYPLDRDKAISRAWLELQYGWRPLLQDIYGSAEFLAKKQTREIFDVVRSRNKRVWEETKTGKVPATPIDFLYYRDTTLESSMSLWFSTDGAALATAKEAGLTNPALLAWELLPYSFVVDWFIPIGNYLGSLDATIGLGFQKGHHTFFQRGTSSYRLTAFQAPWFAFRYNVQIRSSRSVVACTRTVLTDWPELRFPPFKNPFSFEHALNAIALLRQSFKR